MSDVKSLRIGDRVRLLRVPATDAAQRERARGEGKEKGVEYAGWTADTIDRIIAQDPFVTISRVDEYGFPWFECELISDNGTVEEHYLNIADNESWEFA